MHLSREQVSRIAQLARLALTEEEITKFQVELSRILDYVEQLNELDTTTIETTCQVTGIFNQLRPDVVNDEFPRDQMLASALETAEGHLKVKSIFGRAS